ncbi:MAG: cytochrome c peroxidase, partial [Rhizomicrobium sp.]
MRGLILGAALAAITATAFPASPSYVWHLPPGVTPPPVPADNPMSDAKVSLGRRLFYDADLSVDGTTSCATCHEQHRAFTEGNASHPGVGGVPGRRNVMALGNVAYFTPLTWADSTQRHLEQQMRVPVLGTHPVEMGMAGKEDELARRLSADGCYQQMFLAAFPQEKGHIDMDSIGKALASFERTLISYDAPYDRFRRGDGSALSQQAKQGLAQFASNGCTSCHSGENFTDLKFHATKAGAFPDRDHGLIEITGKSDDEGAIRTASLRNVALTMPYLHDGTAKTLPDAIRRHAAIEDRDMNDIVAFLQSLSDTSFVTNPDFALPKMACGRPN